MTIAKKPAQKKPAADVKASKFIAAASNGAGESSDLVTITLNVPRKMLERINRAATEVGQNRTAFMIGAAADKVRSIEGQ